MAREIVILECTSCKERNYTTKKDKRKHSGRIEQIKFCPRERKRTTHKETK